MEITSVRSTFCFVASGNGNSGASAAGGEGLAQVVRVAIADAPTGVEAELRLTAESLGEPVVWRGRLDPELAGARGGPDWVPTADAGLAKNPPRFTAAPSFPDGVVVEVAVPYDASRPAGTVVPLEVRVEAAGERAEGSGELIVRRPGWRMLMVAHFHYDPVWWNTQAGYTSGWDELVWALDRRESFQHSGLALVEAHLERARVDPAYKFVLAEVDYLKPFWDLYPDRREELRHLLATGRVEIVGGTYNEPNTNLTGAETAIRDAVYGIGFQRDVMGAEPRTAWQLDVFGHDPQFPGIMADCGVDSSAWARGPFHQWGPARTTGSNAWMQFPSEFEWIAPNGKGLVTSYMPDHYSAGWELERATTLPGAMWRAYELFESLAEVSAAKLTLLPVGTDYTPPSRWITEIASTWADRYVWPRFEVGLPREFFQALDEELEQSGRRLSPQTRDMNPIYTGKDVSFIDTKQAQRLAETWLAEAETFAALGSLLGAPVPTRALDKAWRQLIFGAHHDGITGSESDQVYLDLLAGWREAYELARSAAERSRAVIASAIDTAGDDGAIVVTNTLGTTRRDLVALEVPAGVDEAAGAIVDEAGSTVAALVESRTDAPGRQLRFLAEVPGLGHRTYRLRPATSPMPSEWEAADGCSIANERFEVTADPSRGGGLSSIVERDRDFSLVPAGEVANELLLYPEYPNHPEFGEGPWHLLPSGPPLRSSAAAGVVRKEVSGLGERLIVEGSLSSFSYRQIVTLWHQLDRIELRTEIHGWEESDHLLRLRLPTTLRGATAVSAVGDAVIARPFALIEADAAEEPWTLDLPAAEWFGLSTTLVIETAAAATAGAAHHRRSVGVAEVVTPPGASGEEWARDLLVALVQKGVTATCSEADRNRYGGLLGDSNLPDFRIAVGGPGENAFVADALEGREPARSELERQLADQGWARLLLPGERPLADVWVPNADVRAARALPVLVVAGTDAERTAKAVAVLAEEVRSGRVRIEQPDVLVPDPEDVPDWTVALVNRGTPGFAVDVGGALHVSLLRACSGWPSGVWIDPPRRHAPDGSAFELEHWSHVFEHAVVLEPGDWRAAGCVAEARSYNRPMLASREDAHPGRLAQRDQILHVERQDGASSDSGRGEVVLAALKPAGNALASGNAGASDGRAAVVARLYEAHGTPGDAELVTGFPLEAAWQTDLLEQPRQQVSLRKSGADASVGVRLESSELATIRLEFAADGSHGSNKNGASDAAEVAQPVFSRYWLHNKGAAPIGNQAIAVHVLPAALVVRGGEDFTVTAQVASGSAGEVLSGAIEIVSPQGWEVDPPSRLFSLAAGAFERVPVTLRVPELCHPGRYFVFARAGDATGQVQEDVLTVDVLPPLAESAAGRSAATFGRLATPAPVGHPSLQQPGELEASVGPAELVVAPGAAGQLTLVVNNRTRGVIHGEAQLLSPVETWQLCGPWIQGFELEPGETRTLEALVRAPGAGTLRSWALFKIAYFGRLWYSPAVALTLGRG